MSADQGAETRAASLRSGAHVPPEEAAIGCRNVTKTFGSITAVDDVELGIADGDVRAEGVWNMNSYIHLSALDTSSNRSLTLACTISPPGRY